MELLLSITALRRAGAVSVTAIIPYFGYARQDRVTPKGSAVSAAEVARLIEFAGADRQIALDLHSIQAEGYTSSRAPLENLPGAPAVYNHYQRADLQDPVVVAPDVGGVARAEAFQEGLRAHGIATRLATIAKQRRVAGEVSSMKLLGTVKGADVILVDDMIDTAGTLCKAASLLKEKGAQRIFAYATHGIFSSKALQRLLDSQIDEVVVTDTIQRGTPANNSPIIAALGTRLKYVSVSEVIAHAILT